VLGVVTGISVSLLAVTRLPWTGPMIGLDGRYLTDVALVAVVCLALASMPMRGGLDAALNPAQSAESPEATETAHAAPVRAGRCRPGGPGRSSGAAAAPASVGRVFGDAAPVVATWTPALTVVRPDRHLARGEVRGPSAVPAGGLVCSSPSDPRRGVAVTLPDPPPNWVWKVEISYSSDHVTKAAVRYGSAPAVPVRLEPGLRRLYVATSGAGPDVRVTDLDPGAVAREGRRRQRRRRPLTTRLPAALTRHG
jgi:hypothetical protein